MNAFIEKSELRRAAAQLLTVVMVMITLPLGVLMTPVTAGAATALNTGNPFTNGDLLYNAGVCSWSLAVPALQVNMIHQGVSFAGAWDPTVKTVGGNAPEIAGAISVAGEWASSTGSWGVSDFSMTLDASYQDQTAWTSTTKGINIGLNPFGLMLHCIQHTHETTESDLPVTASIQLYSMDYDASTGVYSGLFYVMAYPSVTSGGSPGAASQAAASKQLITITWQNSAWLKIQKSSGDTSITGGNDCYRLAGAQYGVYRSQADAKADTGRVATLTTDASGATPISGNLVPGACYVRELTAPPGYLRNDAVFAVALAAGQTATFKTVDQPCSDPVQAYAYKVDRETGAQEPQGSASLAGAQFTVDFYAGYYASAPSAQASGSPLRSWVFQTDARGVFSFWDTSSYTGGDPLYRNLDGKICLPLGTYVYYETQASPGYLLPADPTVFATRIVVDASSPGGARPDGDLFGSQTNVGDSTTVQREQVIRGDLEIAKICDASSAPVETGLAGIQFTLTEQTSALTYTITTNDAGFASTHALLADGSDLAGALPYGTYLVHEVESSVPAGLSPVPDFSTTIAKNGQLNQYILNDAQVKAAVQIKKIDATTGKAVTASAMSFEILDADGQVVSFTRHSPEVETVTRFSTNTHGVFTLPQQLPWGNYYVHELEAPDGYNKAPDQIFSVTADASFDAPLVVEVGNQPQMAQLAATKLDLVSQTPVADAVYGVYAADDIITADGTLRAARGALVDTISIENTTTPTQSKPLFCGAYELRELIAPEGYLLDPDPHQIELAPDRQVTIVQAAMTVEDDYTKLRISKTDLVSGAEIDGAELTLTGPNSSIVATWTTDGRPHEIDRLEPGDYVLSESCAPDGYLTSEEVTFTVRANSEIQTVVMKDDYTKLDISKQAATTGKELPGATLLVKDGAGNMIDQWISTDRVHRIEHLRPGVYSLTETIAPRGYQVAQTITFSVLATGEVQRVAMKDELKDPLPSTGDFLSVSEALLAVLIICVGSGMLITTLIQRRRAET
ncbi:MAG: SpaA isopeptide-forming pilin-related protein [Actinomycetia bacterium]|nr:SpaA isopeptide-forming pilin-related protein [Actinomycetes bacterium]